MSAGSLAKTEADFIAEWREEYQRKNPGPFRAEEFGEWILKNKPWEAPKQRPLSILVKRIRNCFRKLRIVDDQGRKVRPILPVKTERLDARGNKIIDVVYDHLHEMDLHHALLAFTQRDENIEKQKISASRDLQSALDNNPNLVGCAAQFKFAFMTEDAEAVVEERISQTIVEKSEEPSDLESVVDGRKNRNQKSPR